MSIAISPRCAVPSESGQRRGAFTLLEVLVVVAIIGLLVALLLPAGLAVRSQAYATMCASNLRQMGTAWMMYANDNRGAGCPLRPPKFPAPSTNLYLVAGVEVQ